MATQYQVIGQCAHVRTVTAQGKMTLLLMKGAILPPDAPQEQIEHLLSVKLIAPIGEWADAAPSGGVSEPVGEGEASESARELVEKRAAARAKLPADGSLPHHAAGQPVWVEYLAGKGYDYDALATQEKADLVELAKNAA